MGNKHHKQEIDMDQYEIVYKRLMDNCVIKHVNHYDPHFGSIDVL